MFYNGTKSFHVRYIPYNKLLMSYSEQEKLELFEPDHEIKVLKEPSVYQLELPLDEYKVDLTASYVQRLQALLESDLNFHGHDTSYASHDFHSFPAKFPPQLPGKFIRSLTNPGDVILDPMMGSGTTVVEACLTERRAIGFDIDPLAILIASVKTKALDVSEVVQAGQAILKKATENVDRNRKTLEMELLSHWDDSTKSFVDYWFALETQVELLALVNEIQKVQDEGIRAFCEAVFSACIITKSGGVSLAFDLAHTRPHRAKIVWSQSGEIIVGEEFENDSSERVKLLTKKLRSALLEFQKRYNQNVKSLVELSKCAYAPVLRIGNAQNLELENESVDLIVTSPPYASNAIDYMRAHKFSLVWLGYHTTELTERRGECIGGEKINNFEFVELPSSTQYIVNEITSLDGKKGKVLHRYYSEMTNVLSEVYRVLKPDRAAILVVGSSVMRNRDTETQNCLAEIGKVIGFEVPHIGIRTLDRNRRMMPAGAKVDRNSQIQQRMHEEYVIGFYKPA